MEDLSRTPAMPATRTEAHPLEGGRPEAAEGEVSPGPQLAAGPPSRLYGLLEELAEALPSIPPSGPALLLLAETDIEFLRCIRDLPVDTDQLWEVRGLWEVVRRLGRSGRGREAAEALEHFWMMLDAWLRRPEGVEGMGWLTGIGADDGKIPVLPEIARKIGGES